MPSERIPTVDELATSFLRSCRAENLSPRSIGNHELSLRLFGDHLTEGHSLPSPAITAVDRAAVEGYLEAVLDRASASTAATYYRLLRRFFGWCVDEEEIDVSPMAKIRAPQVPEQPVPVIAPGDLSKLLKSCSGTSFEDRRDLALFSVLLDTGVRLGELAGMKTTSIEWDFGAISVLGKGRKERAVPFGRKTTRALDRYSRARDRHPMGHLEAWWIGKKGRLTDSGISQVLARRSVAVGLPRLHPHQFRHTFSHEWLSSGGSETDLMMLNGWRSRDMLSKYGASAATERAQASHRRLSPADRLG